MFLGGICMAGADLNVGDKSATDMSYRNWSSLRCRVEEGFGHSSKVLEDGTIQVRNRRRRLFTRNFICLVVGLFLALSVFSPPKNSFFL